MAEETITLYPPITSSWMPAFLQTQKAKIYFSLSDFNSISEVQYAQVICVAQNTNQSILNKTNYPIGIKMIEYDPEPLHNPDFGYDEERQGDDKYYVQVSPNDLQDPEMIGNTKAFYNNEYYKVQIRLASTDATVWDGNPKTLYQWNTDNLEKLSEWSRVCIIRPIAEPQFTLKTTKTVGDRIVMAELDTETTNEIPNAFIGIQGKMYFNDTMEKEVLDHYRFVLYQVSELNPSYNSNNIFVNSENPNQINFSLPYNLQNLQMYFLKFYYETSNGYEGSFEYTLQIQLAGGPDLVATLSIVPDEENGCMVLRLSSEPLEGQIYVNNNDILREAYAVYNGQLQTLNTTIGGFDDYLTILRASNKDNYTVWEDLHTEFFVNYSDLNYVYLDYTAEAGILYKYAVQKRSTSGGRGAAVYEWGPDPADPTHIETVPHLFAPEHIYLITKDKQVILKFDADVSSYKYNISENSTETIGSKYPFVMRNGNVEYRQFNISGKISSLYDIASPENWNIQTGAFDDNEYETNKKAFYGSDYKYYDKYLQENRMSPYTDIIYEKLYRDDIISFLKDGKVKLFKSTPEGNIMVRLTNISLNPEKGLGRIVYGFQATAIEVADCTVNNYIKFNIIDPLNQFEARVRA